MRKVHLANSLASVLEYVVQPAGMLLAAPILLHHLGLPSYGLWLLASAAVGAGSIVSSGFGDATIQRVASLRASNDHAAIRRVIGNMLSINLVLGSLVGTAFWLLVPLVVDRVTHGDPSLRHACLWSLRIGAILMLVKAIESVFISTQRAYEAYAPAVQISVVTRLVAITASIGFALCGFGVVTLMLATSAVTLAGAAAQWVAMRRHLGPGSLRPSIDRPTFLALFHLGGFAWLQALSSVFFSQADRILIGASLGASAVAYYGTAVQMAQPIHGLTAAGLHFLFPYLASRTSTDLRRPVLSAFTINLLCATTLTLLVVGFGPRLLALWMGPAFAEKTRTLLPLVAVGFGLLALNVTAHYTLMALGRVRLVALVNLAGGALMLLAMIALLPTRGLEGAALARLWYGPATLLLYLPLVPLLRTPAPAFTPALEQS